MTIKSELREVKRTIRFAIRCLIEKDLRKYTKENIEDIKDEFYWLKRAMKTAIKDTINKKSRMKEKRYYAFDWLAYLIQYRPTTKAEKFEMDIMFSVIGNKNNTKYESITDLMRDIPNISEDDLDTVIRTSRIITEDYLGLRSLTEGTLRRIPARYKIKERHKLPHKVKYEFVF